ncbi:universal stress protein [Allosphingosinicella vermicomposti]|uniref:universal stress protein n=1 Tax=Allosphingosinicella vermicomposti TaxID=614671 RepID=UPI000D113C22|nr:universal stress protein [Allosphingosinicella vermicomposti]
MTGPILVATDFSTRSDRALRRATIIAKDMHAEVVLIHVVDVDQPQYAIDARVAEAQSILDGAADTMKEIDGISARVEVIVEDVFSGILQAAERVEAGIVVLGPHRRRLRDAFFGTTAERTIARSLRPVLIAAGVPSVAYERTLVAFDLDEAQDAVAKRARCLKMLNLTNVVAMHAFDAPAQGMMKRAMSEREAIDHYVASEGQRAYGDFSLFLEDSDFTFSRQVLAPVNGTVARSILDCASDEDAGLIVVGTGRDKGLSRFVHGSVAQDILACTDRDVLIVPNG